MICMFEVWEGLGNLRGFTRDRRVSSGFKPTNFDNVTDLMQVLEVVERYNQTLQGMISSVDSKGSHWLPLTTCKGSPRSKISSSLLSWCLSKNIELPEFHNLKHPPFLMVVSSFNEDDSKSFHNIFFHQTSMIEWLASMVP